LARRAGIIDSLEAHGTPFLHLDLGDFTKNDEATGDFETRFIWDTMEKMKVAAVALGPRELGSWKTFSDLLKSGTIPVVSSNVERKVDGADAPVGVSSLVIPVNGIKVGLFSLMGGPEFAAARAPEDVEFVFQDPFETAQKLVPGLHKQADLVVLMSEMSPSDTDRLIQAVPGIDVALYGQKASWVPRAKKVGDTITNQTGTRGQYTGELVLIVDPENRIVDFGSQNASLDSQFPEDPEIAKLVVDATNEATKLRNEARRQRQAEFEDRLSGERFLGAETCRRCHEAEYRQWSESPHAHALASLDKPVEGKPRTTACVSCHVTGYGQPGGYSAASGEAPERTRVEMANVQCEACHGKGTEHQRTGHVVMNEATCRACHSQEWSPGFDFQAALAEVKH